MVYVVEISTLADVARVEERKRPEARAVVSGGKSVAYTEWGERCM